jgi:PASTA domain
LREYSIPHLRQNGKISIPEESFDRIREARDLHKEGLGTESVRRALREGNGGPDTGEIKAQIDRLSESLEKLRGNGSAADEALSSQAMRTVLARQSLIMSAMFNLTEMVEELLLANGKPRKTVFEEVDGKLREVAAPRRGRSRRGRVDRPQAVQAPARPRALPHSHVSPSRPERFGSLARRRRRASLALLPVLLVVTILLLAIPAVGGQLVDRVPFLGDRTNETPSGTQTDGGPQERQAAGGEAESGNVAAAQAPSADEETPDSGAASGAEETGPGEVPDVSGQEVVDAARALSEAGYDVAAVQTVKSQEEPGTTVKTEPTAGSAAEPGTPVVLVMSGGPSGTETGP